MTAERKRINQFILPLFVMVGTLHCNPSSPDNQATLSPMPSPAKKKLVEPPRKARPLASPIEMVGGVPRFHPGVYHSVTDFRLLVREKPIGNAQVQGKLPRHATVEASSFHAKPGYARGTPGYWVRVVYGPDVGRPLDGWVLSTFLQSGPGGLAWTLENPVYNSRRSRYFRVAHRPPGGARNCGNVFTQGRGNGLLCGIKVFEKSGRLLRVITSGGSPRWVGDSNLVVCDFLRDADGSRKQCNRINVRTGRSRKLF